MSNDNSGMSGFLTRADFEAHRNKPNQADAGNDALAIDIELAIDLVRDELIRATKKFGPFHSAHEGYAVILEELDELFEEVKANDPDAAHDEAIQVAAMAIRFMVDVG